jgi:hypothetical protein
MWIRIRNTAPNKGFCQMYPGVVTPIWRHNNRNNRIPVTVLQQNPQQLHPHLQSQPMAHKWAHTAQHMPQN